MCSRQDRSHGHVSSSLAHYIIYSEVYVICLRNPVGVVKPKPGGNQYKPQERVFGAGDIHESMLGSFICCLCADMKFISLLQSCIN